MRLVAIALAVVGVLLLIPALLWFGYPFYVAHFVAPAPATLPVISTTEGTFRLGVFENGDRVAFTTGRRVPAAG